MNKINAYSVKALVALVFLALLAPIPGAAQHATPVAETPAPTEIVTDPDTEVIEEQRETSTPEATVEAAPSGQRVAPVAVAPPVLTLFGSTEPGPVPVGFVVRPEVPAGAYIASFRNARCSGSAPLWSRGLNSQTQSPQTIYFVARWGEDDSTRGNCLAVTWERISEPALASEVCGDNNDVITLPKVQPGISYTDTWWVNNERTITLEQVDYYSFPSNQQTVFVFEDDGPCESVIPIQPVQTKVCGTNNDVIRFASDQPAGVIVNQSESWSEDSTWTVSFSAETGYIFPVDTKTEYMFTDEGPCETDAPVPPVQIEVCGTNNDVISFDGDQPENVIVDQSTAWSIDGAWSVIISAAEHHILPDGTQTEYIFTDDGPCETDAPIPPVQTEVCGTNNDIISFDGDQPENVIVDQSTAWSEDSTWTVIISAAEHHILPDGTQTEYIFTDDGPCETDAPIPPVQTEVCGTNNDVISFASDQPGNVIVTQSEDWNEDGTWSVTFSAAEGYLFPAGTKTEYVFEDEGPCETDVPVEPVQTEVCGANNDIINFASDQPANVLVTRSGDWSADGTWTVSFAAAENYKLPADTQTDYIFIDEATPCPTDAPAPPVQSAVCGANNDLITFPDEQPEGITLNRDSGWDNNTRTISFAVAPEFQTDGPTAFTFIDAADPCPIPTMRVIIQLETANGGSIEGSPWQLSAPLAAQLPITEPYLQGTVSSDNQIVLNDLIAGTYRLVVNADDYDVIDEILVIEEGEEQQTIRLQVQAIRVPAESPTPEPAITPTIESTPTEIATETPAVPTTAEPTPAPTEAAISGLPNTGAGSGMPGFVYLVCLVLIAAGIGALTRRPARK